MSKNSAGQEGGKEAKGEVSTTQPQVFIAYQTPEEDEIDLVQLGKILWTGKKIIIGAVVAGLLVASVVAFGLPRIYRAKVQLLAPSLQDVAPLTVAYSGTVTNRSTGEGRYTTEIYIPEPEKIYERFLINLNRPGLRYQYYKEFIFPNSQAGGKEKGSDEYNHFLNTFDRGLKVNKGSGRGKKTATMVTVTLDGTEQERLAGWLDSYITFVDRYTVNHLVSDVQALLAQRIRQLRAQIKSLRYVANKKRLDRITQLQEALVIAKRMGIEKPVASAFVTNATKQQAQEDQGKSAGLTLDNVPLYFQGYKALQEELEQLQKRKNNDAFISRLPELEGELTLLKNNIQIPTDKLHSIRTDQTARVDDHPIKPRRKLIVALGGMLGLMLGVVWSILDGIVRSKAEER